MSTPSICLSGEACARPGKIFAGRTLMARSQALRIPRTLATGPTSAVNLKVYDSRGRGITLRLSKLDISAQRIDVIDATANQCKQRILQQVP